MIDEIISYNKTFVDQKGYEKYIKYSSMPSFQKVLNEFEHKGKTFLQVKVFYGSSKLDVAEMAKLLDIVIMMAQKEGIELTYYG